MPTPENDLESERESEHELSPEESSAIKLVTSARWAWVAQVYLVAAGCEPGTIAGLVARGLLVMWDLTSQVSPPGRSKHPFPVGLCVTLTPYYAEALGLTIVEVGASQRPRWSRPGEVVEPDMKEMGAKIRFPELIVDEKTVGPAEVVIDEVSEEPVELWGEKIPVDPRLKGKK